MLVDKDGVATNGKFPMKPVTTHDTAQAHAVAVAVSCLLYPACDSCDGLTASTE